MHQVLAINEVVREIVTFVDAGLIRTWTPLLNLTRVNKMFSAHALDFMWLYINGKHLIMLLKITGVFHKDADGTYSFSGAIPDDRWDRALSYGRRVHRVYLSAMDLKRQVNPSICAQLEAHVRSHGSPLFPALVGLFAEEHLMSFNPLLLACIPAHLHTAKIALHLPSSQEILDRSATEAVSLRALLNSLAAAVPKLDKLILQVAVDPSIYDCIGQRFHQLKDIMLSTWAPQHWDNAFTKLILPPSQLQHLTDFEVLLGECEAQATATLPPTAFPALRTLKVFGSSANCSALLSKIPSRCLREFVFIFSAAPMRAPDYEHIDELCTHLGAFAETLETVEIVARPVPLQHTNSPGFLLMHFVPGGSPVLVDPWKSLLRLSRLKTLKFCVYADMTLSSGNIRDMAASWPEIETLEITCKDGGGIPSVFSLAHFAVECPKLRDLHLPSITDQPPPNAGDCNPGPHKLRRLAVGGPRAPTPYWRAAYVDIEDVCGVATFLNTMFPEVAVDRDEGGRAWWDLAEVMDGLRENVSS